MTSIDTTIRHTTPAGGNVFADLGFPVGVTNVWEKEGRSQEEALTLQIKAQLMLELRQIIHANGWNQAEAAKRLGITQPRVSYLVTGQVSKFTTDKLLGYVAKLGYDFALTVTKGHPEIATKRVA